MRHFLAFIVAIMLFTTSSSAQKMSAEDTKEAIISAIECCNSMSVYDMMPISYNTVMVYENFFKDKVVADSVINELNRNQSDIVFYNSLKALKKKNRRIDGSWSIFCYSEVDTNIIKIDLSCCFYKGKKTYFHSSASYIICKKSDYSGKWHVARESFIAKRRNSARGADYSALTKQLYKNLQNGVLEIEPDYILLFNYLIKQDDSEYYPKIKELLKCLIDKNPEIDERVQTYFYLYKKVGTEYYASTIEKNYNKILDRTN